MTMLLERPYHGRGFWSAAFLLISLTLAAPAYAAPPAACTNTAPGRCYSPCDETWIERIWFNPTSSGVVVVIVLSTGIAYDVADPRDQDRVDGWTDGGPDEGDHILICDTGMMVNKDRAGGETAKVTLHH